MDARRRAFMLGRRPAADAGARIVVTAECLARRGVECRVCADLCEPRALRFVPARGGIAQMRIDVERCTGCGDCIAPCPVGATRLEPAAADARPAGSSPAA